MPISTRVKSPIQYFLEIPAEQVARIENGEIRAKPFGVEF